MQVTYLTIFWSVFALVGVMSLYFFNQGLNTLTFVTSRKYILLILIASLFGMRESYWIATLLLLITGLLMYLDYKPFIRKRQIIKELNNAHNPK